MPTDTRQERLQEFLQRFDALADAVGPLDQPDDETAKEVARLLLASADQCGIAFGIFDMAENMGHALASQASNASANQHNLSNPHRRGRMVVVPGFGDEDFKFPDVDTLVNRALSRVGGGDEQPKGGKGKGKPVQSSDEPDVQTSNEPAMLLILSATKLDDIMRLPSQPSPTTDGAPKTATRDLLFGHTTEPDVCFLRDAERLVESACASDAGQADEDGVLVVEFVVKSQGSLPSAILDAGEVFLKRAELLLTAAEELWYDQNPPSAAEAIPTQEKQTAACSS